MYVYIRSEPGLYTVGFWQPPRNRDESWRWIAESDHSSPLSAAQRVHWLNGGDEGPKIIRAEDVPD